MIPKTQSLSVTKSLENDGLLTTKKGLKRPNGKGYSVGNVGEHSIITPANLSNSESSPRSYRSEDEDVPDFEDIPDLVAVDEATKLSHPGLSTRSIPRGRGQGHTGGRGQTHGRGKASGRGRGQGKRSEIGRKTIAAQKMQVVR